MSLAGSVALVVNPTSGRGRAAKLLPQAISRLRNAGVEAEVFESRSATHATELAATGAQKHPVVVAFGGDGMVHLVANGVIGSGAALGILPSGTGNDFASNLGYGRRDALGACEVIAAGRMKAVDVGKIEDGPWFVCVAGGGFDSEVNRVANRMRFLRGTPVYVAATLRTLARFRPARFAITLDGDRREVDAMLVAVGNAASYGGGMRICPAAILDDGLFDVTIVGAVGRLGLLRQFPRLFKGTHVKHPAVHTAQARTVRIESERPFLLFADGEEMDPLPATLSLHPGALRVVAP